MLASAGAGPVSAPQFGRLGQAASLGGFLNLPAFAKDQLNGDDVT